MPTEKLDSEVIHDIEIRQDDRRVISTVLEWEDFNRVAWDSSWVLFVDVGWILHDRECANHERIGADLPRGYTRLVDWSSVVEHQSRAAVIKCRTVHQEIVQVPHPRVSAVHKHLPLLHPDQQDSALHSREVLRAVDRPDWVLSGVEGDQIWAGGEDDWGVQKIISWVLHVGGYWVRRDPSSEIYRKNINLDLLRTSNIYHEQAVHAVWEEQGVPADRLAGRDCLPARELCQLHWDLYAGQGQSEDAYLWLSWGLLQAAHLGKEKTAKISLIFLHQKSNQESSPAQPKKNQILNTKLYTRNSWRAYWSATGWWRATAWLPQWYHQWRVQPQSQTVPFWTIDFTVYRVDVHT